MILMPRSPETLESQLAWLAWDDPERKCPGRSREPGCRRKAQPEEAFAKDPMSRQWWKEPGRQVSLATLEG